MIDGAITKIGTQLLSFSHNVLPPGTAVNPALLKVLPLRNAKIENRPRR